MALVPPPALPPTVPSSEPPVLRVNRYTRAPIVCQAHEAKVASHGLFDRMVITSPNMDYIPPYPVETMVIETYADGLWGPHEYSRTPQRLTPGMWHIACIPKASSPPEVPDVLWMSLSQSVDWKEDPSIGFNGIGFIVDEVREHLVLAAQHAIRRFEDMAPDEDVRKYGRMLVMILRQVVDRMRHLPATSTVAIAVAAHVQRICLELAGLKTYVEIVVPRRSSSVDYSKEILPVLGTFVAEGSDAMNTTRVGLPTWFLQPLTAKIPVWTVVESHALPYSFSRRRMDPPILQRAQSLVGVGNLTGNWKESMLLTVSRHVAGSHLASLSSAEVPIVPDPEPAAKRPRLSEEAHSATHLRMSAATPVEAPRGGKRTHRPRHRGQGRGAAASGADPGVEIRPNSTRLIRQSLTCPLHGVTSLAAGRVLCAPVGVVPRSASSALYFYPPPFLLDTFSSVASLPADCPHPDRARWDEKIHRYLHNLVRIRRFLRARVFDPSLSHEPLSINEWRAALWGDYAMKTHAPTQSAAPSDFRRAYRRQGQRNGVRRLFSRVAQLRSYRADESVAAHSSLRRRLLWESHEINFRAEVMALDTLLREALVSGIWGPPSSAVTVIPAEDEQEFLFRWMAPDGGGAQADVSSRTLRTFARVLARWPDCPEEIVVAGSSDVDLLDGGRIQAQAVEFYVRTFVKHYSRLPVPPIAYIPVIDQM
ncbi:hypothetical protein C8T65DRAFT_793789 [Cerioporus squamosus]|nr:hypothetical protein C8T65DRAFT_793789 [Cerioporus squamosus]